MASLRPRSVPGMLWHLARFHRPTQSAFAIALLALTIVLWPSASPQQSPEGAADRSSHLRTRIATFNIEYFPQDQRQVRGAFQLIAELDVSALGLQEITDPTLFAREAKGRLGSSWEFVHQRVVSDGGRTKLHIGVLYDSRVFALEGVRSREETRVDERTQATLQVDLRERRSDAAITLLVVHFKAMPEGREQRRRQFKGLLSILQEVHERRRRVMVMGDFNATEEGDRSDLRDLSELSGMVWATRELQCSAFWDRAEDCPTSRLDHILSWQSPRAVQALGGCAEGCQLRDRCPIYRDQVSDHCPIVIEVDEGATDSP